MEHDSADDPDDEPDKEPDDHLGRLCFEGTSASRGVYRPQGADLHLEGRDRVQDAVVLLHEAHHGALNDSTAWGSALHVLARLEPVRPSGFGRMLGAARRTHESFATYASVSIAAAQHVGAEVVLEVYPDYRLLFLAVQRLLDGIPGAQRRYMAVVAAARLAMQTPILSILVQHELQPFPLATLRAIDRPDGRWDWLTRTQAPFLSDDAAVADRVVLEGFGAACLDADDRGNAHDAVDDDFDAAWGAWELCLYERLAERLRAAGGTPLGYDGHVEDSYEIVELARVIRPDLGLRVLPSLHPAPDDRGLAGSVTDLTRHHYTPEPWQARLLDLKAADLVTARADHGVAGEPTLVIDVRLPTRLSALYRWDRQDRSWLDAQRRPVVAVRSVFQEGGESVVGHSPLRSTDDAVDLHRRWDDRGTHLSAVAAGCLVAGDWNRTWLPVLHRLGPVVFLVDIELDRFVKNWVADGITIEIALLELADASGITRYGVAVEASNLQALWFFLGDEVSATLLVQQVQQTPGLEVRQADALGERWRAELRVVATNLLATESFTDLNGLDGFLDPG